MRYIEVERIDKIFGRVEYEQYCFGDDMTDEKLFNDQQLVEDFKNFVNDISIEEVRMKGVSVEEYVDNCSWNIQNIEGGDFYGTQMVDA